MGPLGVPGTAEQQASPKVGEEVGRGQPTAPQLHRLCAEGPAFQAGWEAEGGSKPCGPATFQRETLALGPPTGAALGPKKRGPWEKGLAHVSRGCGTVMWGQMGHAGGRMGGSRRDAGGWAGDPGI